MEKVARHAKILSTDAVLTTPHLPRHARHTQLPPCLVSKHTHFVAKKGIVYFKFSEWHT